MRGQDAHDLQQHVPGARRYVQRIGEDLPYTAQTRSAKQTCEAHGGYYDIGTDYCEIGN
jgi:hypothetical protein